MPDPDIASPYWDRNYETPTKSARALRRVATELQSLDYTKEGSERRAQHNARIKDILGAAELLEGLGLPK